MNLLPIKLGEIKMKQNKFKLPLNLQYFSEEPTDVEGDEQTGNADQDNQTGGEQKPSNTFTQEDVNNLIAREKNKAQEKIFREIGVTDFENAKEAIAKYQEWQESQKSEAEKQEQALSKLQSDYETLKAQLEDEKAHVEALKLGVTSESLTDAITLAKTRVNDDTDFNAALKSVIESYPNFTKQVVEETKPSFLGGTHHNDDKQVDAFDAILSKYK